MLDLPGFRDAEDKLLIYSSTRGDIPPEMEEMLERLCLSTFGVTFAATKFEWPEDYWHFEADSLERYRIENWFEEHERRFETTDLSEEEAVAVLKRLGLDFTDDQGHPLRCTRPLSRSAEAVAKGICGKMPDRSAASLSSWENKMATDAQNYLRGRRGTER
jgi:hypothetical protein